MHLSHWLVSLLLAIITTTAQAKRYSKANDAVLLSNVRSLTLYKDKLTTGRRSAPVQQLTCIGGSGKKYYEVDVMRCRNSGSEYDPEDIQWSCQASLPPEFKLGSTEVICEGYDSPDDKHVLKGSCGVEYRLILTELGEEKYGKPGWFESGRGKDGLSSFWSLIFWVIFIVVILIILFGFLNSLNIRAPGGGRWPGGGGGGGWGGGSDDDPPPPYTPRANSYQSTKRGTSYTSSNRNSNSGPGFWSGAGLGGAAGYAAGNYMGQRQARSRQQAMFGAPGPSNYGGGSSWFGSGGRRSGGGGFGSSPSSSSSPAPSSSRYESTGFGGTRRR